MNDYPGNDPRPLMYKPAQAWAMLNVGRQTFYNLVNSGQLELVKVGRSSFVTAEALDRFVKSLPVANRAA